MLILWVRKHVQEVHVKSRSRTVTGSFGGRRVTNALRVCPHCLKESNEVEYFITVGGGSTEYGCPKCNEKHEEGKEY